MSRRGAWAAMAATALAAGAAEFEPSARIEYRNVDGAALHADVFAAGAGEAPHPAILFFFGGGWTGGTPAQFHPFAEHLAGQGVTAIAVEYRVRSRHGSTIPDSMADAFAAFRWAQANAAALGIDPARIAVGGGSAGGHLAAAVGTIAEHAGDPPAAMVLYNPATDLGRIAAVPRFRPLVGDDAKAVSPLAHVQPGAPPTIIFHGDDDATVPITQSEAFCAAMTAAGNRCELVRFPGEGHGFFNHGRAAYATVLARTVEFLGQLQGAERSGDH